MNNNKREKIIKFIQDNLINYMFFATSLFTVDELKEFERMATYTEEELEKCHRWEINLGVKYEGKEFDKYINRISKMKTHIVPDSNWEGMCLRRRASVLIAFKSVFKYLKPENYGDTIVEIDHDVVNDLYEKNKDMVRI